MIEDRVEDKMEIRDNFEKLVLELCKLPQETPWLELKHNNYDPKMIGEDISALANSAALHEKNAAYMLWGIHDVTHELVGTEYNLQSLKKGNQELENWLRCMLSKNADFEFHSICIKEAVQCGLLKPLDPTTAPRYMKYIPVWA